MACGRRAANFPKLLLGSPPSPGTTVQVVWLGGALLGNGTCTEYEASLDSECPDTMYRNLCGADSIAMGPFQPFEKARLFSCTSQCIPKSAASTESAFPSNSYPHLSSTEASSVIHRIATRVMLPKACPWSASGATGLCELHPWQPHRLLTPARSAPLYRTGRRRLGHERTIRLGRKRASHLTSSPSG